RHCPGAGDARRAAAVFVIGVLSVFATTSRLAGRCYEDLNLAARLRAHVRAKYGICAACAIASSTRSPVDSSAWPYSASARSRPKYRHAREEPIVRSNAAGSAADANAPST